MVKLSKDSLDSFQSALESIDASWQTEFNLQEVVRQSFSLIKKAKKYKVSWETIAELLQQSSGTPERISPESIRQYYFEIVKKSKKKKKTSQPETIPESSPTLDYLSESGKTNLENIETPESTSIKPEPKPDLKTPQTSAPIPESPTKASSPENRNITQPAIAKSPYATQEDIKKEFLHRDRRKSS